MFSAALSTSKCLYSITSYASIIKRVACVRNYSDEECKKPPGSCTRAHADIPPERDPECPMVCKMKMPRQPPSILYKIKLKITEGGTNFGTPFRWLDCAWRAAMKPKPHAEPVPTPPALPEPKPTISAMTEPRRGAQVSILGADTPLGQYVSLLLKQCHQIKRLRLYEAKEHTGSECSRELNKVAQDLQHIDTNCLIQCFGNKDFGLGHCLQSTDIVLILENGYANVDMPIEKRFNYQAPLMKKYADTIAHECPKAFIIVCATPIDCMVPLVAETLKETGWYDPRKLLGSVAVPEMRATSLAARALSLDPRITRVPCVGGTEGEALVPLFSRAVEYFDFTRQSCEMLTETVRSAPQIVARNEGECMRAADLSEAYAIAGLVTNVANALLCLDVPRVSGFVETDASQVISPARYLSIDVLLNRHGICRRMDFPENLSPCEVQQLCVALSAVRKNVKLAEKWLHETLNEEMLDGDMAMQKNFHIPAHYDRLDECHHHLTY